MNSFGHKIDALTGEEYYEVYLRGQAILEHPLLNKGAAFSLEERVSLGLRGLLRSTINTMENQVARSMENYRQKTTSLERYIYLQSLQDRNETLFYRLLCDNLLEMIPIVYTPVVGEACIAMSHIMRRYRGVYIDPDNIQNVDEIFDSLGRRDLSLIVVTDGERILGLGDLGSDGMGIPVGKVNLYVAAGGMHPACCLPVCLDVGTNNQRLLADPMYLGYRKPRIRGAEYDALVERFVLGVRRCFPSALLQWEDFSKHTAFKLLERYRERIPSFDDDIQGTGAATLAALMTAMRIRDSSFSRERFVVVGMGQAGVGIARNIQAALAQEGLSANEIRQCIWAVDAPGLLFEDTPGLDEPQLPFVQPRAAVAEWRLSRPDSVGLLDVIRGARATVLIGVTGQAGLFDATICQELARNCERPVIMALSNPTANAECTPEEVLRATGGRALMAAGSPFEPITVGGMTLRPSQCNNIYIFPGVGLGVLVSKALRVTDRMFLAASRALSTMVDSEQIRHGALLPPMSDIRRASFEVAKAVAIEARDTGLGRLLEDAEIEALIARAQWDPHYYAYRPGKAS
ncbi:MAG: NAD-dependent malic enzyme [Pseudomonadota bacterium]